MDIKKIKFTSYLWAALLIISCFLSGSGYSADTEELNLEISGKGAVMVSEKADIETLVTDFPWSVGMEPNASVTLKAFPDVFDGWIFLRWEGDLTGTGNPVTIDINDSKSITAIFVEKEE